MLAARQWALQHSVPCRGTGARNGVVHWTRGAPTGRRTQGRVSKPVTLQGLFFETVLDRNGGENLTR